MRNVTDDFVDFLVSVSQKPLNKELSHEAVRCIVDYLGVLYAGKGLMGHQADKLVNQFSTINERGAQVFGFVKRTNPESAAFLNGYISHAVELDDGVNSGIVHPGTPVLSALFSFAESRNVSEEQFFRGIIVGYELGKILNKETIFSERVNGEFKLRRDFKIKKGSRVLIVEDVITTGKSSLECSKLVTFNKGIIVGYASIIDRSNGKSDIQNKIVSQVELNIPTYQKDKLPKELLSIPPIKPGS